MLPAWFGISKLGELANVSAPVAVPIANLEPSSALSTDHVRVSDASTSVAEKVKTAVLFSGMLLVAGGDVITGASLTLVTLTVIVCMSLNIVGEPLSVTFTVTT